MTVEDVGSIQQQQQQQQQQEQLYNNFGDLFLHAASIHQQQQQHQEPLHNNFGDLFIHAACIQQQRQQHEHQLHNNLNNNFGRLYLGLQQQLQACSTPTTNTNSNNALQQQQQQQQQQTATTTTNKNILDKNSYSAKRWRAMLSLVADYMSAHQGQEPKERGDCIRLYKWLQRQRAKGKKGKLDEWQVEEMMRLGIVVVETQPRLCVNYRGTGEWSMYFGNWKKGLSDKDKEHLQNVHWLCSHWHDPSKKNVAAPSESLKEHMVKNLKVGDVKPSECTRDAPIYDIRHNLSYIRHPYIPPRTTRWISNNNTPTDEYKWTSFFGADHPIFSSHTKKLIEELIMDMPAWWFSMYKDNGGNESVDAIKEYVVEKMTQEDKWTDHLMVNKKGTNPSDGSCPITQTTHPGPRRLSFSVERHPPIVSSLHQCHIVPLYGYGFSFTPKWWMGCNSLRHYETINKLGIQLWKEVWEYLDPLSQVCPPTGGTLLTYFGCFNGKIPAHRDNSPSIKADYWHNSQMVGTTVMVLSLFDDMHYDIVTMEPMTKGQKDYKILKRFTTSHGSLYLMSAFTDIESKHTAEFPQSWIVDGKGKKKKGLIRVGVAWRWVSRRAFAFDHDYMGERKRCEVWHDCKQLALKRYPRCQKCQCNFDVPVGKRPRR